MSTTYLNFDLNAAVFNDIIDNINTCNYYDSPDLTHELYFSKTLHIHVRSLQKHINGLQEFVSNLNFPDKIAITETRIKDQLALNIDVPKYKFLS